MLDDMPRKLPPHVTRERDRHGKIRFYFRIGKGQRTALPAPTEESFAVRYQEAMAGKTAQAARPVAARGTLTWLVDQYRLSGAYLQLAASTRADRDAILRRAVAKSGAVSFASITARHIETNRDKLKPHAGNNFLAAMGGMFRWAKTLGLVQANPTEGIAFHRAEAVNNHTWTVAEVEQFQKRWPLGTRERLAMDLMVYTGLRRSDVYRLGRQHVTGGMFTLRTQKTKITVSAPILPPLAQSIAAAPTGDLAFLVTANGRPFASAASFGGWFSEACRRAGIPGRAHGLRRAAATLAAEAGASSHELRAMFGWATLAQAERYTKAADNRRLSMRAAERIANAISPNLAEGSGKIPKRQIKSTGKKPASS